MQATATFSFGEWVSRRRKTLDMAQRDLATQVSCAVATIKKIEADERRPSRDLAALLADALRVPSDWRAPFLECARGLRPVDVLANMPSPGENGDSAGFHIGDTLPVASTPFIGRAPELGQIADLLSQSACRLLTLVGVGGVGKTRLAAETARTLRGRFADGTVFVSLTGVADAALIPASIAHSLRLTLSGSAEAQLSAYLRGKTLLLVLDNCEQFGDGVVWLSDLLASAPGVKLLATARERLQLADEWVFTVPELDESQAVDLFAQTAQRVLPAFDLASQYAGVVSICKLVENLPLALELAAGWTPFMPCAQIADHIRRDLDFLAANIRSLPERHRSVRAVFDHSWWMLSAAEQTALMRLSVFRGGWTPAEAESVAGAALPVLRTLAEKSLVRVGSDGRYDLHELTRQYTADKLHAAGQESAVRQQHSRVYAAIAAWLNVQASGADGIAAFARFEQEQDNLRAALAWTLEARELDTALTLITSLFFFWLRRGYWQEGEHWTKAALAMAGEQDSVFFCRCLRDHAVFTALQGRFGDANPSLERAVPMARRLGDPEALADVLLTLSQALPDVAGACAMFEEALSIWEEINNPRKRTQLAWIHFLYGERLRGAGRHADAAAHFDQSLQLYRQLGNVDMIAYPLGNLGRLALQAGRLQDAYNLIAESVIISRAVGNRVGIADWSQQLASVMLRLGDTAQAEATFEETLALFEEMGNPRGAMNIQIYLGYIALVKGEFDRAAQLLHDSLSFYQQFIEQIKVMSAEWRKVAPPELIDCLIAAALLNAARGDLARAVTLLGSAELLRVQNGYDQEALLQAQADAALAQARVQLPPEVVNNAWDVSHLMTTEAILSYALKT